MNALHLFSSQPWVDRLGWTLVHFIWQGASIFALYAATRRWMMRSSGARSRYVLACSALALMTVVPFVTLSLTGSSKFENPAFSRIYSNHPPSTSGSVGTIPHESIAGTINGVRVRPFLPWIVAIWLSGTIAFWVRLMGGWLFAARMQRKEVRPAPQEWQRILSKLGTRVGLLRPVRLLVSALVQVPTVVGWLRPVVLVPIGALAGLPPEHMEALLVHELAHIRRHDYLINILQSVAEALLFYHPAVWWVSGHIRIERELCCDDVAVALTGDTLTYACALADLESFRPAHFTAAVAANGGSVADRIGRLIGRPPASSRTLSGPGLIVSAVLIVATAGAIFSQAAASQRFDVALIKASPETRELGNFNPLRGGGLTVEKAVLRYIIQMAYDVQPFQISGAPDWIDSAHYDMEAKADPNASSDQVWVMMQALLEDRFKLKVHREMKALPVYELTVATDGLKLPQPKEDGCRPPNSKMMPLPPSASPPEIERWAVPTPVCGRLGLHLISAEEARLLAGKVSMTELTTYLSDLLGLPVVDKTGFKRTFDLDLSFIPDEALAAIRGSNDRPPKRDGSIFTAMQEQLGLKLASANGPVEVLVIDHVERPTENLDWSPPQRSTVIRRGPAR